MYYTIKISEDQSYITCSCINYVIVISYKRFRNFLFYINFLRIVFISAILSNANDVGLLEI